MKIVLILIALACTSINALANPVVGMPTGSRGGTYFPMGLDIARLAAQQGLVIQVKPSVGSLDNIRRMAGKENAGISIVQSDVVDYLTKNPGKVNRSVLRNLRLVFPLYDEEVHLLARKEITSIRDLEDKQVAVGKLGSGTYITANNILDIVDVNVNQVTDLTPKDAFASLILGKIDAVFFVGGKPVKYINGMLEMGSNEQLSKYSDAVHLVPIDDARLDLTYSKASFYPDDYKTKDGLRKLTTTTIPSIAVKAILVSHEFSRKDSPYYKLRCQQISKINTIIRKNLAVMTSGGFGKETYHPKWAQVDLDQPVDLAKSACITEGNEEEELKLINCYLLTGNKCI